MSDKSAIEWCDSTWNPIVGCSIVSPGCTNCYAMKMAARITAMDFAQRDPYVDNERTHYAGTTQPSKAGPVWTGEVARAPDHILTAPLRWKRGRRIFVNSMGDLFHESIPDEWIDKVFAVMALCPQHTFQVLTKRAERMRAYFRDEHVGFRITRHWLSMCGGIGRTFEMPLPNVWLGVSCERQQEADERIPLLLATPAAVRFISAEPLLGAIDLTAIRRKHAEGFMRPLDGRFNTLDWVIVGGESGPNARPMNPEWARSLRDQCSAAGVPFFFKQWGEWSPHVAAIEDENGEIKTTPRGGANWSATDKDHIGGVFRVGKKAAGRLLDGVEHNGFPKVSGDYQPSTHRDSLAVR